MSDKKNNFIFFGSSFFSIKVLEKMLSLDMRPSLVVIPSPKKMGRGQKMINSEIRDFVIERKLKFIEPEKFDESILIVLKSIKADYFIIASYGKILKKELLDIPPFGVINIHPSLLPKYRGPTPMQNQIIANDKNVGVSIMLLDEKIDHGPIIAQKKVFIANWPINAIQLKTILATEGALLLNEIINDYINKKIIPRPQEHSNATFTEKIKKQDGLINLEESGHKNYLKFLAFKGNIGTFFILKKNEKLIRIKIEDAELRGDTLEIKRVIPEGKKEMGYKDFLNGYKK